MKKKLIWLALAVALLLVSLKFFPYHCNCTPKQSAPALATGQGPKQSTVTIGSATIAVDIADTPVSREQGLSGRQSLCADCGMLFIFPQATTPGFWMKDMNFALDIVWVTPELTIAGVERSLPPSSYPRSVFPPMPVRYVLELPAGTFDKNHFYVGEKVRTNLTDAQ